MIFIWESILYKTNVYALWVWSIDYILRMLFRTFIKEDFDEIQMVLKEQSFDWKDLLTEEEYDVASVKKYFSEIAKNDAW